jgi:uncharacterized protein YecT (DUF1311 family)
VEAACRVAQNSGRMIKTFLVLLAITTAGFAQNQQELNQQAQADFVLADKELNTTYKALIKRLDPASKNKLVDAQLLWIKYRDANATARSQVNEGGSMQPMIYAGAKARTTRERTAELKEWLAEYDDK